MTSNRSWGRWVGSDHYYSLNADDKLDFQEKLGSMGGKWSLLFSERRWQTWLSTEAGIDGWEVIIIILWTPMTNLTFNRSWGRWVGSDHYYSLNADDKPDFQQKLGSMGGKWSLLFSERRWPTWLPTEGRVDWWKGNISFLWTSMTNLPIPIDQWSMGGKGWLHFLLLPGFKWPRFLPIIALKQWWY